jgi:prepilin-type N-terminal cleavage/methylation domain-containing protein
MRKLFRRNRSKGITLVELLIGVTVIGILTVIAIPNVLSAQKRSRYARAACEAKTAVTVGIMFSNDRDRNPGSVQVLRETGYANVSDTDPWDGAWVYSAAYADTSTPANRGEMGVCSKGPVDSGDCSFPMTGPGASAHDGSVGFSSVYGAWQGLI